MKYRISLLSVIIWVLFGYFALLFPKPIHAACSFSGAAGATYASTCIVDAATTEIYDYYASTETDPNTWTLTLDPGASVTINGDLSTETTLYVGKIILNGGTLFLDNTAGYKKKILLGANSDCWLVDADSDGYPTNFTCSPTKVDATYHRKANMATSSNTDCCDPAAGNNTDVHYGQTAYFTATITNCSGKTGTYDYDCSGVEDLQYTSQQLYACTACSIGSTPDSVQCDRAGWIDGVRPGCGGSNTWFGQVGIYCSTGIICANPVQPDCVSAGFVTQSARTQGCH